MEKRAQRTGTILMLTAGTLYGVADVFTKGVYVVGVNLPFNLSIFRLEIAIPIFLILIARGRIIGQLRVPIRNLIIPLAYGIAVASFMGFFLSSLKLTSVANSTFLIYTAPIYVVVVGHFWLNETVTHAKLVGILLSLLGAVVMLGLQSGTSIFSSANFSGDVLALAAGVSTAGQFVVGRLQRRSMDPRITIFYAYLFAFLFLVPVTTLIEGFDQARLIPALPYALCSSIGAGVASLILLTALRRIEASKGSIYALVEPIMATLIAGVFLGEIIYSYTIIGGAFILTGVIVVYYRAK